MAFSGDFCSLRFGPVSGARSKPVVTLELAQNVKHYFTQIVALVVAFPMVRSSVCSTRPASNRYLICHSGIDLDHAFDESRCVAGIENFQRNPRNRKVRAEADGRMPRRTVTLAFRRYSDPFRSLRSLIVGPASTPLIPLHPAPYRIILSDHTIRRVTLWKSR